MHLKKIGRELRRELFGSYKRRRSRSRSRSRSPYRHRSYEERSHGSRGHSSRYDDEDRYPESWSRRNKTVSPGRRKGRSRSRSPGRRRRNQSPVREGSEERRAKIEQWNRERAQDENASQVNIDRSNINEHAQMEQQNNGREEQQQ